MKPTFAAYPQKECAESQLCHFAVLHAAKKLVRLLYYFETTGEKYIPQSLLSLI
jgi:hypothetical protein